MSYAYLQVNNPILPMDKQLKDSATVSSALWNNKEFTYDGVRPPKPQTIPQYNKNTPQQIPFQKTNIPNITQKNNKPIYDLWQIQSQREPYAVQYLVNQYGGLQTRVGTNYGT